MAVIYENQKMAHFDPVEAAILLDNNMADPERQNSLENWLRTVNPKDAAHIMAELCRDKLTGLLNDMGMSILYEHNAHEARTNVVVKPLLKPAALAIFVLMADVEALGVANNSAKAGYHAVDMALLKPIGESLAQISRLTDNVGRTNGDEYKKTGIADTSEIGPLPDVARRHALRSLAGLASNAAFATNIFYNLNSAGITVKAATISAETPWSDAFEEVDPKIGMEKGLYNYAQLPDYASLHRIYKSPRQQVGYLTTNNEGGWFVPYPSVVAMSRDLGSDVYEPAQASGAIEINVKNVPHPYADLDKSKF